MPRIKKTKSSQLAHAIDLIESGVKELRDFNDNIDPLLLDSEKLKAIKPLIENLAKTFDPPAQDTGEPPAQDTGEPPAQEIENLDQQDKEFDACAICSKNCAPDSRPDGVIAENNMVKSCPEFQLNPEYAYPNEPPQPGYDATLVHKINKPRRKKA